MFKKVFLAGSKTNDSVIVVSIMLFMTIGGACGVSANAAVALIPIGIILAHAIGLDTAAGFMVVYFGPYSGFNVGWAVPATLGVAHPIAELLVFSGMSVRIVIHIVNFILNVILVLLYVRFIRKDYTKSLNYAPGLTREEIMGITDESTSASADKISLKQWTCLITMAAAVASVVVGSIVADFGNQEIAAIMLLAVILQGLASGSGQAAAIMPLMVQIADLGGITRQVAVQAFQFGDGLSNCIIPTAGTIMAYLGMAKVSYNRYVKWYLPFFLVQCILASSTLVILQTAGWMGI